MVQFVHRILTMMQIISAHHENAFRRERRRRNGAGEPPGCIVDVIPSFQTDLLGRTVCAGCAASTAADLTLAWPVIVRSVAHLGANHGSARNVS